MIIKNILSLLKKLDRIDTGTLFGHYSTKYVWQEIGKMEAHRAGWRTRDEIAAERKELELKRFYSILYTLKKQGFVDKNKDRNGNSFWQLTKNGLNKLVNMESREKTRLKI